MEKIIRKCILKINPYKPGKPIEEVERELGIKEAVKLASNENPFSPPPGVLKAIINYLPKINRYPDDEGYYLKKKLAEKLRVAQKNIILGCGSDEIIELVTTAFLKPGEEVIFGDPSFVMYRIVTHMMGGRPVPVPLKDYTYDLDAIEKAVSRKTKIIFIANPNNPTGTIVKADRIRRFIKKVGSSIIIVFDEAYAEYAEDKDYPNSIDIVRTYPNCIVLRTFSKIMSLAGLRIGYGVAGPELIGLLNRVRPPFNTSSIAQAAALQSLKEKGWVERIKKINSRGKKYLYRELEKMSLKYVPTEANFILVKVGNNAGQISEKLLRKGVIVRSLSSFGLPECIRVTIGMPEENKKFVENFKKVMEK